LTEDSELNDRRHLQVHLTHNFVMNADLICYCHSQIFELSHIFEGFIICH